MDCVGYVIKKRERRQERGEALARQACRRYVIEKADHPEAGRRRADAERAPREALVGEVAGGGRPAGSARAAPTAVESTVDREDTGGRSADSPAKAVQTSGQGVMSNV